MNTTVLNKITYLVGSPEKIEKAADAPSKVPFADDILSFLSEVSKILMHDIRSKAYSDVATFAFWIRNASMKQLESKYGFKDSNIHLGRGVVFHITPSNVPVNFAYSLVSGLLAGNANIVRVPSKDFPQVLIITEAINIVLDKYVDLKPYVLCVRYERSREINDVLSSIADTRIVWGGDQTISELRKSPLPPRSTEITFADRYSLAVIDSDLYMESCDKGRVAEDFYNDTYFSDQNACTSPWIVVWTGNRKAEAKEVFWSELYSLVKEKYTFQDIMGVNKLTSQYLAAAGIDEIKLLPHEDNLIVRVEIRSPAAWLMKYRDNSGYFFECDCDDVMELKDICNDKQCQTIGMIGDSAWFRPLIESGVKGVDRVVSIGHAMDFDLIWDGYDLIHSLVRTVVL